MQTKSLCLNQKAHRLFRPNRIPFGIPEDLMKHGIGALHFLIIME